MAVWTFAVCAAGKRRASASRLSGSDRRCLPECLQCAYLRVGPVHPRDASGEVAQLGDVGDRAMVQVRLRDPHVRRDRAHESLAVSAHDPPGCPGTRVPPRARRRRRRRGRRRRARSVEVAIAVQRAGEVDLRGADVVALAAVRSSSARARRGAHRRSAIPGSPRASASAPAPPAHRHRARNRDSALRASPSLAISASASSTSGPCGDPVLERRRVTLRCGRGTSGLPRCAVAAANARRRASASPDSRSSANWQTSRRTAACGSVSLMPRVTVIALVAKWASRRVLAPAAPDFRGAGRLEVPVERARPRWGRAARRTRSRRSPARP